MKKTVNHVILENQVKRVLMSGVSDSSSKPPQSNSPNLGLPKSPQNNNYNFEQVFKANYDDQTAIIAKIERESKEMFGNMDGRITKLEDSVGKIEKSL